MLYCCCRRGLSTFPRLTQARVPGLPLHPKKLSASASSSRAWKHRSIELPVGVSGHVKLDVLSTDRRTADERGPRNLLIHLPPGPSIGTNDAPSIDVLAQLQGSLPPSTSLVSINYRLGANTDPAVPAEEATCFPVPVHDVSTAFDYLTTPTSAFNLGHDKAPKICLVGSNIGGALATMLALTEPNEIHGLAVVEPMVDWAGLDEVVEQLRAIETSHILQKRQKQKVTARYGVENESVIAAAEELIKLRGKLFQTPSAFFDQFASPVLFLRAPGKDTPLTTTVAEQSTNVIGLDQLDGAEDYDSHDPVDRDSQHSSPSTPPTIQPRRRKVLRRWSAVGLPESVTLPYVKIFVRSQSLRDTHQPSSEAEDLAKGHAALMRAQGLEMAELMRRACFMGREKSFAEERVQVHEQGQDQQTTGEHDQDSADPREETAQTKAKMQQSAVEWVGGMFARD